MAVGIALAGSALARLAFPAAATNEAALIAYEAVLCAVAVGLLIGLLRASWERVTVTDLVVSWPSRLRRRYGTPSPERSGIRASR